MATAAGAAAARMQRARRQVQHHFFAADAVRADRATDFVPGNRFERRWFAEMQARGVIHDGDGGGYWLDIPAYDALLRHRLKRMRVTFLIVLGLLLLALAAGIVTLR